MIKNKIFFSIVFSVVIAAFGSLFLLQRVNDGQKMTVYKSATCGCCNMWIKHMEDNGFSIKAVDVSDMGIVKQQFGISRDLVSCHTALVDGYVVEGHVPAIDVKRLLSEKPDVLGLSVPGMPVGSPGMEMGDRVDHYSVITMDKDGNTRVFNQY